MSAEILRVHPDEPEPDRVKYIVSCLARRQRCRHAYGHLLRSGRGPGEPARGGEIYEIKSRLKHKPLSLLMAEVEQAYELARDLGRSFDVLAERFWPGPLTLIVRAGAKLPLRSTANTGNVALAGAGCGDSARGGGGLRPADYGDQRERARAHRSAPMRRACATRSAIGFR